MQKILNKLVATILTVILVGTNFVPALTYAASEIEQNAKTSQENVEFNASINDSYDATINVNDEGELKLNLKVAGTGYLKDATVTLNDNNYQLIEQKSVEIENGNTIKLNEVNAGEVLNLVVPIKVNKQETVLANEMNRESSVTLNATYVNEKGKEKQITKELKLNLSWVFDGVAKIEQTLLRYIKYDGKTMLSFKINDGIVDNTIPYDTKKIDVQVPTLNGVKPSKAIVIGENIKYNYEDDQIIIEKGNSENEEGKINWDSQDSYIVTYIYDLVDVPESVESNVTTTIKANGQEINAKLENSTYDLKEQKGSLVETEITGTNEINKGYMYTNLSKQENKLETEYNLTYTVNIGYKDLIDKIVIKEQNNLLGKKETRGIESRKITIDRENLINILGEDGYIKVTSESGMEIGKFYRGLSEITTKEQNLVFETSKPMQEGNLVIHEEKVIIDNNEYNKEELKRIETMTIRAAVESYNGESKISSSEITKEINLIEPTSEASININMDNLSTVVTNENVILTATLETNSINKALYKDPKLRITLPEEVKNINLKEATLIYEDELQPTRFETNKNNIELDLNGVQTKYSNQSTSEGTVLRLVADLELDNLATTQDSNVKLLYSNEATGEVKEVVESVGIVAPAEFITTSTIAVDGNKLTAQEDEKIAKVTVRGQNKEVSITGTIVNNLGVDAEGIVILGRIPTQNNKDAEGKNLGSNFDTTLATAVNVEGENAEIYYSNNIEETIDGSSWTIDATTEAKSFKIVLTDNFADKSTINFNYKVSIPNGLDYGNTSKATYAVYYNNNAQRGNNQNVVMASAVGLTTGEIPTIQVVGTIIDTGSEQEYTEGANVKEGTYITYKVKVTNTGKETARKVTATTTLPDGIRRIKWEEEMGNPIFTIDKDTKTLIMNIEEIAAGASQEFEYKLSVLDLETEAEKNNRKISTIVSGENVEGDAISERSINVVKGCVNGILYTKGDNRQLKAGDNVYYTIEIKNVTSGDKTNVQTKIVIPEELEIVKVTNGEGTTYSYDERTHTITYNIATLKTTERLYVSFKIKEFNENKDIAITASIQCNEMETEEYIEPAKYKLLAKATEVKHTSNISEISIRDQDELIYYIDVKNNLDIPVQVNLKDQIPYELGVKAYKIKDSNGEKTVETTGRIITARITANAGETVRLTIITEPYNIKKGSRVSIENTPVIEVDGQKQEINSIKHTIIGTSDTASEPEENPNGNDDDNNDDDNIPDQTEPGTYILSGIAWIDRNENGKKDEDEERLSGQTVKLYNKDTGKLAVDINGKELTGKTNSNGRYSFTNVKLGNYIVVIEYNTELYAITSYKAQDLLDSEDSDFIEAKQDEKDVAATNTIAVIDANIYNIDLGLVYKKKFDLRLDKTINRITVTNTNDSIKTRIYDFENKAIAKVELPSTNIDTATVTVEYSIKVTNEGQVPGYAKQIVDYLPKGMTFNSELNTTWYVGNDGNAYNTSLANTIINPGETKEIRLVLTRKISDDNLGTVRNTAEIVSSYNELGLADADSIAGNKKTGEDDISSADTIIGTATGRTTIAVLGITLGILSVIAVSVYAIKKYVISKIL